MPPDPPRRDHLRRSIIIIRLLKNFCQLLEKLWVTLTKDFINDESQWLFLSNGAIGVAKEYSDMHHGPGRVIHT